MQEFLVAEVPARDRSKGDGFPDGAGDEAAAGGPGQQFAQDFAGLGEDTAIEAALQVAGEMGQAPLGAEAAFPDPVGEYLGPFVYGAAAAALLAGYGVGHVVAEFLGHGLEAVDFEFIGVFALEGVYQAADLGEGHGLAPCYLHGCPSTSSG